MVHEKHHDLGKYMVGFGGIHGDTGRYWRGQISEQDGGLEDIAGRRGYEGKHGEGDDDLALVFHLQTGKMPQKSP